jgi:transposase
MAKRNRKTVKSKWDVLIAKESDVIYIGIDVHKNSFHIAIWKNGQLVATLVMPADERELIKKLSLAGIALKQVVYEAGFSGFGLARKLLSAGLPCSIAAPGKIPQEANQGSKSDRIDCRKLALYAAKDMLKYVVPPTEEEDAERQLVRSRDDIKKKRKRIMNQIKSFLFYNSIPSPEGLEHWSHSSVRCLQEMELTSAHLHFCLNELLEQFDFYNSAMKRVEVELKKLEKKYAKEMKVLQSHPGVGSKTARQFFVEVYQPVRFADSKKVARYLGLAPKIMQSGQTRREGGVIKAGKSMLRSMLIECCWTWIGREEGARQQYNRYCANTGSAKKAIHAMARRMVVNLWNMLMKKEEYRPAF